VGSTERWSGEFGLRRRDGSTCPGLVTDSPSVDGAGRLIGIVGVSVDISARKQAEERLRESEACYRRVVEETLDYMLRELRLPEGGFASAQDADTDGVEGLTFTWTPEEGPREELLHPFEDGRFDAATVAFGARNLEALDREGVSVYAVYFTHGDRRTRERGQITLGKAWLVSRLQALLQTGRILLPATAEAQTLAKELQDYEIKVDQDANDKYGAFRVGTHDDRLRDVATRGHAAVGDDLDVVARLLEVLGARLGDVAEKVKLILGPSTDETALAEPDFVFVIPGIRPRSPTILRALNRGVPVLTEMALFFRLSPATIVGITGTKGKTTTTTLVERVLSQGSRRVIVGGNIGTAVIQEVDNLHRDDIVVLELSSFQLETIQRFRAQMAACLNVTPDHLDRHYTFEGYANAKAQLFERQEAGDWAVLNYGDATCRGFADRTKADVYWFSVAAKGPRGVWMKGDDLLFDDECFMTRRQISLRGLHNVENVMAAALMARLAGAELRDIGRAVESFPGLEHRIEFVRAIDGVSYYNDSKATNVDATLKAIDAFPEGLWIILGGKDKGSDYTPWRPALEKRAKAALLIGAPPPYPFAAAPLIDQALTPAVPAIACETLARAVTYAREHARAGDVVLLAPACASFDQFENFEQRGRMFKQLVAELV